MLVKKTYHNNSSFRYSIAIGNFDGIHLGHKFLLQKLREFKKTRLDRIGILTFHPHPIKVLYPEKWKKNLIKFRTKYKLLKKNNLDTLFLISFNKEFRNLSAVDFIEKILIKGIKVENILVGEDFKFGKNRVGDINLLLEYAKKKNFNVFYFKKRSLKGEIYSSSSIRNFLKQGNISKCNKFLGYYWEVDGRVVEGEARGRLLGYPTANINYDYQISPSNGIYACWIKIEKEDIWRMAAISSGIRPHYSGKKKILEIHIINFSGNLYRKRLRVAFVKKIRNEEKFRNEEELILKMGTDCKEVVTVLNENILKNDNEGQK